MPNQDLSKITTKDLIDEIYKRSDVWIVQHFYAEHIKDLSPKKISKKKAQEILSDLADNSCWPDRISEEVGEEIGENY